MITLYKGDDTGGQLGKNVKIVFHCDDAVDMDDVVVKFDLLGIVKREFTDVHDGDILDIFISHAESRKFPLGVIFAKMWGEDASGKLRTFANRIPFRVTLNLIAVYGSDGTDSQDIHVYSSVDWDSIANKPTVFPSSVEEVEGLQEALDDINGKIPEDASAENQLADKDWVDQEIDRVAAYYITSDAQGNPFQTRAALLNAETYYSGGSPRTPTRNDYAIVLADESHDDTEWRYIYSVNEQGVGTWEAQYPVEGAIVADDNVTKTSTNPVKSSGIWSMIWGALTALPTGFTSLYDWCVSQLSGKVPTSRTINGKALSSDVTLTGADIAVSGTDATKINAALAGKASTADATLTERGFSEWTIVVSPPPGMEFEAVGQPYYENHRWYLEVRYRATGEEEWEYSNYDQSGDEDALHVILGTFFDCTRTALQGYQLGSQTDKPLASEAEAEALRTGKQDALTAPQLANIAAVSNALAFDATHSYAAGDPVVYNGTLYTFTAEHTGAWTGSDVSAVDIIARLAGKLDKSGVVAPSTSASDSGKAADAKATGDALSHVDGKANHALGIAQQALATIPYTLGTPIVIDTASSEVVEGETVYYGAATLANRTANIVQVTAATPLDELRITFPAATSGKVRDFGLRVEIGTGSAALTAPALVPIAPTGETIKIENNAAEIPALADGTATAKGVTLLYSSENAPGVFVVKGEQVEEVA